MARRAGQALLETLLVLLVLCLMLFGFLQAALAIGGRDVLHHAASRAARARAVGFNDWMAEKAARVAAIPVSGRLLSAEIGYDAAVDGDLAAFERARIPEYLASENHARASYVLDYSEWKRGSFRFSERGPMLAGEGALSYAVRQEAPLEMPFAPFVFPWADRDEEGVLDKAGVEGDPATAAVKGGEMGAERKKEKARQDHEEIVGLIRDAVAMCWEEHVSPTRANVLERIGEYKNERVTKGQLAGWTVTKAYWSPFRLINGVLTEQSGGYPQQIPDM